jgi:LPXTG-motif cell wall-anchored protein
MNFSPRISARPLSVVSALLLVLLSLGVNGSAFAAPIAGNGNGNLSNSAIGNSQSGNNGHQASSTSTSPSTQSTSRNSNQTNHGNSDHAKSTTASTHKDSGTAATVGDVGQAQPLSNADKNSGGANGKCPGGPYCSTRDGSPSMNGNGNGQATGKPCAGCVGRADNKNPKGQMPNGTDHNKGYECDDNNGIGKTNPAHTGCTVPSDCVVTSTETCGNPPDCVPSDRNHNCGNPPSNCVPALSQDVNCNAIPPKVSPGEAHRPPKVLGTEVFAPQPKAQVLGTQAIRPATALPNTGAGDGMGLLAMSGLGLLLMGGATLLLRRRSVGS